jgi:hypothetical protein
LLLPNALLDWFAAVPQQVFVAVFVVAVVGLIGIAAAITASTIRRTRGGALALGLVLLFGGLAFIALNPIPGSVEGLEAWWPTQLTQPQLVGSAYWMLAGLGIILTGVGLLATLLITAVTRTPARR